MADVPLCFIDTETTGLDPDVHEIWEVGLILRHPDGKEDVREWLLPVDLSVADPYALKIGRFADRHPQGQHYTDEGHTVDVRAFASSLFQLLPEGTHLVGNVVSFDEERLRKLLKHHEFGRPWHYHLVDVECLVAGKLGIEAPWKSEELTRVLGVAPPDVDRLHTALGDAYWAMEMYDAVMAR